MVELANGLEALSQLLVVVEPAAHFGHQFAAYAELSGATMSIADGQNENRVSFAACTFRTFGAMAANCALKQRAAEDLAGQRETAEELSARSYGLFLFHLHG